MRVGAPYSGTGGVSSLQRRRAENVRELQGAVHGREGHRTRHRQAPPLQGLPLPPRHQGLHAPGGCGVALSLERLRVPCSGCRECTRARLVGDFSAQNGTGGESVYGEKFEDEAFVHKHDRPG